jgi:hypothetical protein
MLRMNFQLEDTPSEANLILNGSLFNNVGVLSTEGKMMRERTRNGIGFRDNSELY